MKIFDLILYSANRFLISSNNVAVLQQIEACIRNLSFFLYLISGGIYHPDILPSPSKYPRIKCRNKDLSI